MDRNPDCNQGDCFHPVFIMKPEKIIRHEQYDCSNENSLYNVALIRMDGLVPLFDGDTKLTSVTPVCLPWNGERHRLKALRDGLTVNDKMTITGWNHGNGQNKATGLLQQLNDVYVTENIEACETEEHYNNLDNDLQICAGQNKKNVKEDNANCYGDVGGPLVIRKGPDLAWYQAGILSGGATHCQKGQPHVYTRVTKLIDWIESKLEK